MTQGITIAEMRRLNKKSNPTAEEAILIHKLTHAREHGWVSMAGPEMRHGVWDHWKGGLYVSTQMVTNVDSEDEMVVYCSMIYGTWFVRRCDEWNELVEWPDGKYRSRFVLRDDPSIAPYFKVPSPVV